MKSHIGIGAVPLALLLLAGCGGVPPLWGEGEVRSVQVVQLAASGDCRSAEAAPVVRILDGRAAVEAWAGGRGLPQFAEAARGDRAHAVIELGRDSGHSGMAVAREATLRHAALTVSVSRFAPEEARDAVAAPCALLLLPADWHRRLVLEVQTPTGDLIARSEG